MPLHPSQIALITGASKRIGRALGLALAKEGIGVAVHYHKSEVAARRLLDEIAPFGVPCAAIAGDLSRPEETMALVDDAMKRLGEITILINNAAVWGPSHISGFDFRDLWTQITPNAVSPLLLTRAFAERAERGQILNLLDCRITDYDRSHAAYHLSKRALADITRLSAVTFAPNIRVNAIAPGLILPPPDGDARFLTERRKTNPLERIGTVTDITDAALFLLKAPFITGQTLFVDGGRNLKGSVY